MNVARGSDRHHGELKADHAVFSGQPCHALDALDMHRILSRQPREFIVAVGKRSGSGSVKATATETEMHKKITVAYDNTPEAERALLSAIQLAKSLGAELRTITVMADPPAYADFAAAGDPSYREH